jgi:hypothetical protein
VIVGDGMLRYQHIARIARDLYTHGKVAFGLQFVKRRLGQPARETSDKIIIVHRRCATAQRRWMH